VAKCRLLKKRNQTSEHNPGDAKIQTRISTFPTQSSNSLLNPNFPSLSFRLLLSNSNPLGEVFNLYFFRSSVDCWCKHVCFHPKLLLILKRNNFTQIVTSPTFSGIYDAISEVNTHLSIPEKLWATWYAWWRNDTLATGLPQRNFTKRDSNILV
jgi:hypothetical protein